MKYYKGPDAIIQEFQWIVRFCGWDDLDVDFYSILKEKVKKIAISQAKKQQRLEQEKLKRQKEYTKFFEDPSAAEGFVFSEDEEFQDLITTFGPKVDRQRIKIMKLRGKGRPVEGEPKNLELNLKKRATHFRELAKIQQQRLPDHEHHFLEEDSEELMQS